MKMRERQIESESKREKGAKVERKKEGGIEKMRDMAMAVKMMK